jgi:2-hydroxychromene-2-carboxylate isomerase
LAIRAFLDLGSQHGVTVRYRPVDLGEVFPHTGGLPLPKRHPARQRYRILELQRWREARGIPLKLHPKHWPFPAATVNRTIVAVAESGADPGRYTQRAFEGVWVKDEDLAQDGTLIALLNECGHDGAAMLAAAKSDAIGALYAGYAQEAGRRQRHRLALLRARRRGVLGPGPAGAARQRAEERAQGLPDGCADVMSRAAPPARPRPLEPPEKKLKNNPMQRTQLPGAR